MTQHTSTRGHGVTIAEVSKTYAGATHPAVREVSLDIAPGEFMTFLGPSGSGKTTMLSMIAGFTAVSGGSICVDGEDISRLKPHKRDLGVVFQQYALFPHMSVTKNVAYPLQQRGLSKGEIAQKVSAALELVSLTAFADRLPSQLSGGQQQRVALARAVVYEPRALLMDEPLGALDKKLRDQLQREIARMHRELGMTFIFVTHDQHEALSLSDRIAVFNEGRVEQVGTPAELYESPQTLFVAQFLGESNIFQDGDGHHVLVVRPERLTISTGDQPLSERHRRAHARIGDITYVGAHNQIELEYDDGARGCALEMAGADNRLRPGQVVTVSWDPAHESRVESDQATSATPIASSPTTTRVIHAAR